MRMWPPAVGKTGNFFESEKAPDGTETRFMTNPAVSSNGQYSPSSCILVCLVQIVDHCDKMWVRGRTAVREITIDRKQS